MKRAVIYSRVSTDEQAQKGYSLDSQEKLCRSFAKNQGYEVVNVYRDEGKSGTSLKRPALQDLLTFCQTNRYIDAMIIQETDRLSRNTVNHLTIKAHLKECGIKVISVNQPMLDDSPEGNMMDTVLAGVNQFYSDLNGRKAIKGMQEKFDRGWFPGKAPLGYLNITLDEKQGKEQVKTIIIPDPERWDLVKEIFELYLTGDYSVMELNDLMYKKGLRSKKGKKIAKSVIHHLLQKSFYAGIIKWSGQEKQGKHKAMITMSQFKRIQQIIASHNLHACRRRKHNFLLRGFLVCNQCGCRYTAEIHPAKRKRYYHCSVMRKKHSNKGQMIEVSELENLVAEQFRKIQFSKEFIDGVRNKLKEFYGKQKELIKSQKQIFYNQKQAVEIKRDKAEEKLFAGVISDEDFVRLRDKFKNEINLIQNRLYELESQQEVDIDVIHEMLKLAHNSYEVYKTAPYELKRQYLGLFWDKFLVQDKKIIEAVPTKLILALQRERKVIIRSFRLPSPDFIKLFEDAEYLAALREKVKLVSGYKTT